MKRRGFLILVVGFFLFAQPVQADWTAAKRLTWTSGDTLCPALAIDSNNVIHIVWYDDKPGNREIYYQSSADGGKIWSAELRLTQTSAESTDPAIAIDSGNIIHVVWEDETIDNDEIYYKRSMDGGKTWSANKRVTFNSGGSWDPAIAIDSSNTIHIVWQDNTPGNDEIYYARSGDGGGTWSVAKRLTWTALWSWTPAIAADLDKNIHVVWSDYPLDNDEIYYRKRSEGGGTWSVAKRLTWSSGGSFYPTISIDSSNALHVVWQDGAPGISEICYKRSVDGGTTWSLVKRLTSNSGASIMPVIAIDSSGALHVVWFDYTPGNSEIYYTKSPDGGTSWNMAKRLTWTSGGSWEPTLALDSSNTVHLVWQDNTPGNFEIYYKNGK